MIQYAELHCTSNFSFLRGTSHPHELVEQARALGHRAIAITDLNTLAGIVRGHIAAKGSEEDRVGPIDFVVGCRLELTVEPESNVLELRPSSASRSPPRAERGQKNAGERRHLLCFPTSREAYGRLTRMLTQGKRRAQKAECKLGYADLLEFGEGQIFVALPPQNLFVTSGLDLRGSSQRTPLTLDDRVKPSPDETRFVAFLERLKGDFSRQVYLAAQHLYRGDDAKRLHRLAALAKHIDMPLVATNDVLYHVPARRRLQDVVSCIREGCTLAEAGLRLNAHAERHLKSPAEMARLFRGYEDALARTVEIAERCKFNLDALRYDYPDESGAAGTTPQERLESLVWNGAAWRFPDGLPDKIRDQIEKELVLIEHRQYAPYFLTVHAIMNEARRREILCQGRGSAANSVVCFCLGITEVNPTEINLLFDRFINEERTEPPDIDVDFEHERREEVIQHIYEKYGRGRAALTATVIHYRPRRAIREVGKVLGLSEDVTAALAGTVWGWYGDAIQQRHVRELGLDPADPTLALALELATELVGFPRHLSQHVGGFVITRTPLDELVPIENAAMADRTVIEWDKDDIDALRMLKIDILALGMLTAIRRGFDLIEKHYGKRYTLATIPKEDPDVYEMLCHADSIGVFQVESRAQMSMLPRLKPRKFYDLVIEVAIVRPGPIQGGMVHPYLRRRAGEEKVDLPSGKEELREILDKTLGVPLFQEQAMRMAMIAAKFTGAEANGLRQAMATFRHNGQMPKYKDKFITGMIANGYEEAFARRCFSQIEGFGEYGFPESHAASFALLVYASAWIKYFYPEVFTGALLNSQPMGFYAPAQLVRDARDHGVEVRPVDVNASAWHCTLEPCDSSGDGEKADKHYALRLGFNQVKGLAQATLEAFVARRGDAYRSIEDVARRGGLDRRTLERLAEADAFHSLRLDRRQALWAMKGVEIEPVGLFAAQPAQTPSSNPPAPLPAMPLGEHVIEDYRWTGMSLKAHPLSFLRATLARRGVTPATELARQRDGERVTVAGIVLVRQRPGEGKVIFMTLEDETGIANLVVWIPVFERFRRIVMGARLVACTGRLQIQGEVIHVVSERLRDWTPALRRIGAATEPSPAQGRLELAMPAGRNFH